MLTRRAERERNAEADAAKKAALDESNGTSQPEATAVDMDIKAVEDMIKELDEEGSGKVDVEKIMGTLERHGLKKSTAYLIVSKLSGSVSAKKIQEEVYRLSRGDSKDGIAAIFGAINKSGEDYIEVQDVVIAAQDIGVNIDKDSIADLERLGPMTRDDFVSLMLDEEMSH